MFTVILRDRYYIPVEAVDRNVLKGELELTRPTKEACRPGCPIASKQGRWCSTCPSLELKVMLWSRERTPKGRVLIAVPAGDPTVLDRLIIGRYEVVDRRSDPPFRSALKWTGKLRRGETVNGKRFADQHGMLTGWRKHIRAGNTGGLIISPPRSGKCVDGNTMIRTDRGFQRVADWFTGLGVAKDIETVGRFGCIQTPSGAKTVRGLFSRVVDETYTIELENGARLRGTPEHPILTFTPGEPLSVWRRLDEVTVGVLAVIPAFGDAPVPYEAGLSTDAAELLGMLASVSPPEGHESGVLSFSTIDSPDPDRLSTLLYSVTGVEATSSVSLHGHGERIHPGFNNWVAAIMASGDRAWEYFTSTVFADAVTFDTHSRELAGAMHAWLLGRGAKANLFRDGRMWSVTLAGNSEWMLLSPDPLVRRMHHRASEQYSKVVSVSRATKKMRVYDVMIPDGKSFVANGIASHNTVIGIGAVMAERSRTLITASKIDFLRQFGKRFGELTNLRELYARGRYPVVLVDARGWVDGPKYGVLVVKKWGKEVEDADVVMAPYQQLLETERGRERFTKFVKNKFGLLAGDEIHQAGADCFSRLFSRTNSRRKLGLTATPHRKDKLEKLVHYVVGPTVAKGNATSDLPMVTLLETGISSPRDYKNWNTMVSFVSTSAERNKIIARQVFKDLRSNPLHNILLPVTRVAHLHELVKIINGQAEFCRRNLQEDWPNELAVAYSGKSDTNAVLNQVEAGRARVVVAIASMVQHGLDQARWTHVYVGVTPTSNPYLTYQLLNRVCTPYPAALTKELGDKPQPVVRFIIDAIGASVFCFAKVFKDKLYGIEAGISGDNFIGVPLCKGAPADLERMTLIAAHPRSYSPKDAGIEEVHGRTKTGRRRKKGSWTAVRSVTKF